MPASRGKDDFMSLFMEEKRLSNRHSQSILQMVQQIKMINMQKRQQGDVFKVLGDERRTPDLGRFPTFQTEKLRRELAKTKEAKSIKPVKINRPRPIEIATEDVEEQITYFFKTPKTQQSPEKPKYRNAQSIQTMLRVRDDESELLACKKKVLQRSQKVEANQKGPARSRSDTRIRLPILNTGIKLAVDSRSASSRKIEAELIHKIRDIHSKKPYLDLNSIPRQPKPLLEVIQSEGANANRVAMGEISGWCTEKPEVESPSLRMQ